MGSDRIEGPFRRKGPDMKLVNHEFLETYSFPRPVLPHERGRVDELRRPMDAVRLETRSGIGPLPFSVKPEVVPRSGRDVAHFGLPISLFVPLHGKEPLVR